MANFLPLKNYMFFCLERIIKEYKLAPPFLDAGCGIGDVSRYLAVKGWHGEAIDFSDAALEQARKNLALFSDVNVSKKSILDEHGRFGTVFLWDVLEHIENDEEVLKKISSLLLPGGHLLIAVPSNPLEWRWDDDFYGHYRRYTAEELSEKLIRAGLLPLVDLDFTYPVFWVMRRIHTWLKRSSDMVGDKNKRTVVSSTVNAWDIPLVSNLMNKTNFIWNVIYKLQFRFAKVSVGRGHEMFVLAQKPKNVQ